MRRLFGACQVAHHASDADAHQRLRIRRQTLQFGGIQAKPGHPGVDLHDRVELAVQALREAAPGVDLRPPVEHRSHAAGHELGFAAGVGPCSTETVTAAGSKGFSTIASSRSATKNCLQPAAASAGATCAAPNPYASALTTAAQSALPTRACSCRQLATMASRSIVSTAPAV
jgi:hypothetical protein